MSSAGFLPSFPLIMDLLSISSQFKKAQQSVRALIKQSDYKVQWFIKGLGLPQSAFYNRYKVGNWDASHLEKLSFLLAGKLPTAIS